MSRSSIIIKHKEMIVARKLPPVHPGEILKEEFLLPMALSAYAVARACGVPRTRIERVMREETPVTADTALRLGKYFGTTPGFWMNLQTQYDLEVAEDASAAAIAGIKPMRPKAA
jgi:addiction module HigA family antidote